MVRLLVLELVSRVVFIVPVWLVRKLITGGCVKVQRFWDCNLLTALSVLTEIILLMCTLAMNMRMFLLKENGRISLKLSLKFSLVKKKLNGLQKIQMLLSVLMHFSHLVTILSVQENLV